MSNKVPQRPKQSRRGLQAMQQTRTKRNDRVEISRQETPPDDAGAGVFFNFSA